MNRSLRGCHQDPADLWTPVFGRRSHVRQGDLTISSWLYEGWTRWVRGRPETTSSVAMEIVEAEGERSERREGEERKGGDNFEGRKGGRLNGSSWPLEGENRGKSTVSLTRKHARHPYLGFKYPSQDSLLWRQASAHKWFNKTLQKEHLVLCQAGFAIRSLGSSSQLC